MSHSDFALRDIFDMLSAVEEKASWVADYLSGDEEPTHEGLLADDVAEAITVALDALWRLRHDSEEKAA